MVDTPRTLAALQAAITDGGKNTAQDVRDFLVSVYTGPVLIDENLSIGPTDPTFTFSSIDQTFDEILVIVEVRTDRSNVGDGVTITVGNSTVDSTSTNYRTGSVYRGDDEAQQDSPGSTTLTGGVASAGNATAGTVGYLEVRIPNYADTTYDRKIIFFGSRGDQDSNMRFERGVIVWDNTADAIDIITFAPKDGSNFTAGRAKLYGIRRPDIT